MNTHQIQCAIDCEQEMSKQIIGVFAADQIPFHRSTPFGFIVNTDPQSLPGKHWIACYVDSNNVLEIFDSYGNSSNIRSLFINRYMKDFHRTMINPKRLQSSNSRVCGQYCLFYLMCRCRGYTMTDITNIFSQDFELNDQYVFDFIDTRFYCCMYTSSGFCQMCVNKI